jgi:endonuclease/exonuclease/phosphatase family metal-dependent hydrolase
VGRGHLAVEGALVVDVRVLYGNCYGGYSLHDSNRKVNGQDYATRVPALISLILSSSADVFLAVEMHEETDSSFGSDSNGVGYLFTRLKAADPDWALALGRSGNHCFYRPSKLSAISVTNKEMPGSRSMSDFVLQHTATGVQWHNVLAHFRANDSGNGTTREKERDQEAAYVAKYVAPLQNALIAGDFNSSTESAGHARAIFKAAGFRGLRERAPSVTNGTRATHSKNSTAHNWIEDIETRKAQTVSNAALLLTGNASDHNGWLVATITWASSGVPSVQTNVAPVTSSPAAVYQGLPWLARVRNFDLSLGAPLTFTRAELVENYCAPSVLTLTGRTSDLQDGAIIGTGVVMVDDQGGVRCSGPLVSFARRGNQTMTLTYRSDAIELAGRIVWPTPAGAWSQAGQASAYHVVTGPAETRLLTYLSANIGATARTERRLASLRQPASLGRGPSATTSARFDILGELMAPLAELASLHFGIRQAYDGQTPYREFYLDDAPDLSSWVRFGTPEAGGPYMLSDDWAYSGGLGSTTVLGAAGGEGTDRILNAVTDTGMEALWGRRVEFFLDQRGSTDASEIAEGLAKSLADHAGASDVSVPLGSVPGIGTTIPIGAIATAVLDGQPVTDRIRQITTVLSSDNNAAPTQVGAVLGSPDAGVASPTWRQMFSMLRRISELERR